MREIKTIDTIHCKYCYRWIDKSVWKHLHFCNLVMHGWLTQLWLPYSSASQGQAISKNQKKNSENIVKCCQRKRKNIDNLKVSITHLDLKSHCNLPSEKIVNIGTELSMVTRLLLYSSADMLWDRTPVIPSSWLGLPIQPQHHNNNEPPSMLNSATLDTLMR